MLEKRFLFADSNQNVVQLGALCNADAMHYIMCQTKIHGERRNPTECDELVVNIYYLHLRASLIQNP